MKLRTKLKAYGSNIAWIGDGIYGRKPEDGSRWIALDTYSDVAESLKWGWDVMWIERADCEDTGVPDVKNTEDEHAT